MSTDPDPRSPTPPGRRLTRDSGTRPSTMVGRSLAHYQILDKLGSGGMGEVYLAEDSRLGRQVALKILPPELAAHPERLRRFQREIRILASLNHPNITTIHSVEDAAGVRFFTMEVVDGAVLSQIIRPDGVSLERFFQLAVPMVDAVAAAHAKQITHRDLKPGNVMVSREGRVKVLDFGLAKVRKSVWQVDETTLLQRDLGEDPASKAVPSEDVALTEDGRILGTGPYMSPEQVRGLSADTRSDVFALGILLFEMITGKRPFRGRTQVDMLSSILRDAPDFAPENGRFPQRLVEIVSRCLEKDPKDRYQDAREIHDELVILRKEMRVLEILQASPEANDPSRKVARPVSETSMPRTAPNRARLVFLAGVLLTFAMVIGGLVSVWYQTSVAPAAMDENVVESGDARPYLAVLHFDNLSGDPELEWLRMGLMDMLVTDLSRDQEIKIFSSNLLYDVLKDLDYLKQRTLDWEAVRRITHTADVDFVVVGNFAKAGDVLRVSIKLQDAQSGEILAASRREGWGEGSIFSIIDELSRSIRRHFEIGGDAVATGSQGVRGFMTSSVEALRYYSEGKRLTFESKEAEAILLFEKAVELDPKFAQAFVSLGISRGNVGHSREAGVALGKALEHSDHLTERVERFARAMLHGNDWATYGLAIENMEEASDLFPESRGAPSNLAIRYLYLERYAETIKICEGLKARGNAFSGNYVNLAQALGALGDFDQGHKVLADFVNSHPEKWFAQTGLAWHLAHWGKFDDAEKAFEKAEELRPGDYSIRNGQWRLSILRESWEKAERYAQDMAGSRDRYFKWRGFVSLARNRLYAGRSAEALTLFKDSADVYSESDPFPAMSHAWMAHILLLTARPTDAFPKAVEAYREGRNQWPERYGVFLTALTAEDLGRSDEANRQAKLLKELNLYPNPIETRRRHILAGLLALRRGDPGKSVAELLEAEKLLPPRGIPAHWHVLADHVPVWYALAQAELAAGNSEQAAQWLERVTQSGLEHIEFPIRYVRSFYLLAEVREEQGRNAEARELYRRFADYWRDGDLDREQIEEAIRKSGGTKLDSGAFAEDGEWL